MKIKLEASCRNQTYLIELQEESSTATASSFQVKIDGADQKDLLPVRILSRVQGRWILEINGQVEDVLISEMGEEILVHWHNRTFPIQIYSLKEKLGREFLRPETAGLVRVKAQMPGKVVAVLTAAGEVVESGQGLAIIEAMKMQNELKSPKSGTVIRCNAEQGKRVNGGELLFEIE
jgi:biotin carboxyl carrier protein